VVLEFKLYQGGQVTQMKVLKSTVGEYLSLLSQKAVLDPSPFAPWPGEMRKQIAGDSRTMTLTFNYLPDEPRRRQYRIRVDGLKMSFRIFSALQRPAVRVKNKFARIDGKRSNDRSRPKKRQPGNQISGNQCRGNLFLTARISIGAHVGRIVRVRLEFRVSSIKREIATHFHFANRRQKWRMRRRTS
jgi:hypothetical protein